MKLRPPQTYAIEMPEEGPYRLFNEGKACKFSEPASTGKHPKLYTLSVEGKLIYVGIASQPMSSRLSFGFRASGKGGYHGYKWKLLRHRIVLCVWTAEHEGKSVELRELETVEAEVAFLCRQQSGQWPAYQHEIHFYPSLPLHREAALQIYGHAIQRSA
jgi:hypothetical protein